MPQLKRLHLENFRSIQNADIEFGRLNVLIGANGSGKSNLISFFKMMNEMVGGRLQRYIAETGRAQSILHFGAKVSPQLRAQLDFDWENGQRTYSMELGAVAGDTLCFTDEQASFNHGTYDLMDYVPMPAGNFESRLRDIPFSPMLPVKLLRQHIEQFRVFHFQDASPSARVRQFCYERDNRSMLPDAANLAAILLDLRESKPSIYRRIEDTIRLIAPFFDEFTLIPSHRLEVILNWRHFQSDLTFGPHQFSDGTLRAICLITLLLQPPEDQPLLLIVDERELGLHPYALKVIASLFQAASEHVQVIISTQSSTFLDHFDPDDVIVAEHHDGKSTFHRPGAEKLDAWLEEYSLGEIWEKNVIGGGPH